MTAKEGHDITRLLVEGRGGDIRSRDQAIGLLYENLTQIARGLLRRERGKLTLSAPELINEVFLRLFGTNEPDWESRRQLLGYAAHTMRQVLVSMARRRDAEKRPQAADRMRITDIKELAGEVVDVDKLDNVLNSLESLDERQARIVEMKFFAGMTIPEIADNLGVSTATITREWRMAKAWLKRALED
ncbi:MAG TPA: ECF-type sigma factor [Rudaea sp.]|nr:ECF-type sigma factor [Rudaea sp.]